MNKVIKNGNNIDFEVDQGTTWPVDMVMQNNDGSLIDYSGYLARMYLKRKLNGPAALQMTTSNYISLGLGFIRWNVPDEVTADLSGEYIYDLELESFDGTVQRLFQGNVTLSPEVTR